MRISSQQVRAIIALPASKRYSHFVKVVADQRAVWGLYNQGWALARTTDGREVFPVWPAREYADPCASEIWAGFSPRKIELDDFIEGLLPDLKKKGVELGVFYTANDQGVLADLEQLKLDVRCELAKIE